jgi:hypothetical protein
MNTISGIDGNCKQMTKDEIHAERYALAALTENWEGARKLVEAGLKRGGHMAGVFKRLKQDVEKILAEMGAQLDQQEQVKRLGIKL